MKITRVGAKAYNGPRTIFMNDIVLEYEKATKEIIIRACDIKDFTTKSHHNYKISLSLSELGKILESVSEESKNSSEDLSKELGPYMLHLIRIINACVNFDRN